VVVQDDAGWQEVARYVHLNPVRIAGLGLDKRRRAKARLGVGAAPSAKLVAQRLEQLREFRWSSYRAYAGYQAGVGWLWREPLDRLCGGKSGPERQQALRQYTEQPVRQGVLACPWERLVGGLVLGTEAFARELRRLARGSAREQPTLRKLVRRPTWEDIVRALEAAKGEPWSEFRDRYGDWGRDGALWLARRRGGCRLKELAKLAGGIDYATAGQAVARFARRLQTERELKRIFSRLDEQLSNAET
jgi:hypothetical protein